MLKSSMMNNLAFVTHALVEIKIVEKAQRIQFSSTSLSAEVGFRSVLST